MIDQPVPLLHIPISTTAADTLTGSQSNTTINNNNIATGNTLITSNGTPITTESVGMLNHAAALCSQCYHPICDRYIMRMGDSFYHERCLQCNLCSNRLIHTCYTRDGKLYCRIDYERLFKKKIPCLGCGEHIGSEEFVMRATDNVFHLKCFTCVVCGIQLQKGEQYVIKQGQLFCRPDYEKEVDMLQGFTDDFYSEDLYHTKTDGRRGPKRPRTILNTQQRRAFKASFDVSPKPCRKVRENLAKETGLSLRIVQVWFQNQRAKVKKIQKKARQEGNKSSSETESQCDSMETESNIKIKDETHSDNDSYGSGLLDMNHSNIKSNIKDSDEHEEECFKRALNLCSSFHNYKDERGDINENMPFNAIMGMGYSSPFHHLMGPTLNAGGALNTANPTLNPIDRLYSMQNSYFRCDENRIQDDDEIHN